MRNVGHMLHASCLPFLLYTIIFFIGAVEEKKALKFE